MAKLPLKEQQVSTHSRPKAAAFNTSNSLAISTVSTHSRPKAAAIFWLVILATSLVSTHSRPKAAALFGVVLLICAQVSTHSRPKAAAALGAHTSKRDRCFNTQPPEGGCNESCIPFCFMPAFQHTAARRRLPAAVGLDYNADLFQHTAARRRLRRRR